MSKQDRQGVRTAAGLEQKYAFGRIDEAFERTDEQGKRLLTVGQQLAMYMAGNDHNVSAEIIRAKAAEAALAAEDRKHATAISNNATAIEQEIARSTAADETLAATKLDKPKTVTVGCATGLSYAGFGLITSTANKTVRITIPMPAPLDASTATFAITGSAYLDGANGTGGMNAITTKSGTAYLNGMGVFFDVTVTDSPSGGAQLLRLPAGVFVTITCN